MVPLWILCNPRSGSTLLCDLLNATNKFPLFEHERLVNKRGPLERGLAFNEWLRLYFKPYGIPDFEAHPVPYTKCIYHQFNEIFGNRTASYVEKFVPGVKFVWLHRQDCYDQAASLYFAKKLFPTFKGNRGNSSSYHIYDKLDLEQYLTTKIEFDANLAEACYAEVKSYEHNWSPFLGDRPCLQVSYEQLVDCPVRVLRGVMDYCGAAISDLELIEATAKNNDSPRVFTMTRPEKAWFINKLKSRLQL